jgi:hypothetical protein
MSRRCWLAKKSDCTPLHLLSSIRDFSSFGPLVNLHKVITKEEDFSASR